MKTYEFLIATNNGGKWIEVFAQSKEAALADINQAYCNVEIIQWKQR